MALRLHVTAWCTGRLVIAGVVLLVFSLRPSALEYNKPRPIERFGPHGRLIDSGSYKDIRFRSYLETRRSLLTEDTMYYIGSY